MSRTAPKMSIDDFKATIISWAIHNNYEYGNEKVDYENPKFFRIFYMVNGGMPEVIKDWMMVDFSTNNIEFDKFLSTAGGVPYAMLDVCGDWEHNLKAIIYFDGTGFRGYVPSAGNTYNHTTGRAYGNDETSDEADGVDVCAIFDGMHSPLLGDIALITEDIDNAIITNGSSGSVDFGKALEEIRLDKLEKIDEVLAGLDIIPKDMVEFVVNVTADETYVHFVTVGASRPLTTEESIRVDGVDHFSDIGVTSDGYSIGEAVWYLHPTITPSQAVDMMLASGYIQEKKNVGWSRRLQMTTMMRANTR